MNADCQTDDDIQEIIGLFEDNLRYNCRVESEEQHDAVMIALKAIGNTGYAERAVNHLLRCASNVEAAMELRIAALQAFRRMPCMAEVSSRILLCNFSFFSFFFFTKVFLMFSF